VYALYSEYGFSKGEIGILFIVGFGSSLVVGTVIGGFADKYGRKMNCLLFAGLYGASCLTKHYNNFSILLFGRLLGGVATSILMSAFETWMIHEHRAVRTHVSRALAVPMIYTQSFSCRETTRKSGCHPPSQTPPLDQVWLPSSPACLRGRWRPTSAPWLPLTPPLSCLLSAAQSSTSDGAKITARASEPGLLLRPPAHLTASLRQVDCLLPMKRCCCLA
jgi:hypothetical protein